jgi:methyltransferase (TIGR00027 family)
MSERLSRTALKIARFIILLDAIPRLRHVLPEGAAGAVESILLESGAVRAGRVIRMRSGTSVRLYEALEAVFGRGQLLWFGIRKRWLADTVDAALREGAKQLLVVGAGFDPLATLVARRSPETLCIEVDQAPTALAKRRGVERAGLGSPNHLVCAADLSKTSLEQVLSATPWRRDVPAVVVAEGLLMYLPPADVTRFLAQVRDTVAPGSRFAFSAMDIDDRGRPTVKVGGGRLGPVIRGMLRIAGEPLLWGISPSKVREYLRERNFRVIEQASVDDLRTRVLAAAGLPDEPLANYEHLVLCASESALAASELPKHGSDPLE